MSLSRIAPEVILRGTFELYWPVLLAVALYVVTFATSLPLREAGTIRRFLLAGGPTWCVCFWGLVTSCAVLVRMFDDPNGVVSITVESILCLFLILLLLVPRNLVSRRIDMPTAFTLGAAATIAAVYADLLFIFVCAAFHS